MDGMRHQLVDGWFIPLYPLVMTNIAMGNVSFIVEFPIKN